jgi:lincosamide nucleotidyltransferase A/C/D/E
MRRGWRPVLRAAGRFVERSPVRGALSWPSVQRLRGRVQVPVDAADVVAIVTALGAAGAEVWLAGGWGVDALLGEVTRSHTDVDLAVMTAAARVSAGAALVARGDVAERELVGGVWMPTRALFRSVTGQTIELVELTAHLPEVASLHATGIVDGVHVPCLSAELQVAFHTGYDPRPQDRADVAKLCERFDLEVPAAYR